MQSGTLFGGIASPHLVIIQGNTADPSKVVLQCTTCTGSNALFLFDVRVSGLIMQGFTLNTTTPGQGFGVLAQSFANVMFNYVAVHSFANAFVASVESAFMISNAIVTGCQYAVYLDYRSSAWLDAVTITGTGATGSAGIVVAWGSAAAPTSVTISNVYYGCQCTNAFSVITDAPTFGSNVVVPWFCASHP